MEANMWEMLRKIGLIPAVLIVFAGVYFIFFYAEKGIQKDVLEFSLNLMGEKLLALVPEGANREKIKELYDGFKQRAINGLVEPEQVETVAANILNVSNRKQPISPQQAEGIIRSGMMVPKSSSFARAPVKPGPEAPSKAPGHPHPEKWEIAGERVKVMFEFNERMQQALKEHTAKMAELAKQMRYQAKDGLNLVADTKLRTAMDDKEFANLAKEFEHLEQEKLLAWQENLSEELAKEKEKRQAELAALQESLEQLKSQHISETLEQLESLKSLEHLEYIPAINADSIHKMVEKHLRKAGIHPPPEKLHK
jgi:hypothetical protein